jgi:hypothetical protein
MTEDFGSSEAGKKGGKARAEKLTGEERREIAQRAAQMRWEREGKTLPPQATHDGVLKIGNLSIPCAVLADGTRVLTQQGFLVAIGRSGKPARGRGSQVEKIAPFLALDNLKSFVDEDLADSTKPILFRVPTGSRAYGYRAELLPRVCEVYLKARDADALLRSQLNMAKACEILMRALAHVGIVALVDEATGYQEVRDRFALQEILDKYLRKEFATWAKRFPDEFYQEIFRLRGWTWKGMRVNRPQCVAAYTKDLVYARLAPGVLRELEARNPIVDRGHRLALHHQWLTEDVGHPALAQHLHALLGLMRASDTWGQMMRLVNRAFPKRGDSLQMALFNVDEDES